MYVTHRHREALCLCGVTPEPSTEALDCSTRFELVWASAKGLFATGFQGVDQRDSLRCVVRYDVVGWLWREDRGFVLGAGQACTLLLLPCVVHHKLQHAPPPR